MSYIDNPQISTGTDPLGESIKIPVQGTKALTNNNLDVGETWTTGWLAREYYTGAQINIYSNVDGEYSIEYSDDGGQTLSMPMIKVPYSHTQGTRKGAFDIGASWVKFKYTNGLDKQTKFKFEIRFLINSAQVSTETLNAVGADSRFAQWTKTRIETKDSDIGTYLPIYRTGNALNVHLDAPINFPEDLPFPTSMEISNFPDTITSIEISNLPVIQDVNIKNNNLTVTGNFYPENQNISGSVNATIQGIANVNINTIPPVEISNDQGNPIAISGDVGILGTPTVNIGTIPSVEISNDQGNPLPITGSLDIIDRPLRLLGKVTVDNFPTVTEITNDTGNPIPVSFSGNNTVEIKNDEGNPISVSGNVGVSGSVSINGTPTVNIGTIPSIEISNDVGNPISVSGTVTISNPTAVGLTNTELRATPLPIQISVNLPIGTQGNAFNNSSMLLGTSTSPSLDIGGRTNVSVFGNSSLTNLNLQIQISSDNITFYTAANYTLSLGNFHYNLTTSARYIRLAAGGVLSTITATIMAK